MTDDIMNNTRRCEFREQGEISFVYVDTGLMGGLSGKTLRVLGKIEGQGG